jgi:hypothetical protein
MRPLLTMAVLFGPAIAIVVHLIRSKSLTLLKGLGLAAMFIGATAAYIQTRELGACGVVLAITGLVLYVEEVRRDVFREMKRISEEENE